MNKSSHQNKIGRSIFGKLRNKLLHKVARNTVFPGIRLMMYRAMGITVGKNVYIGADCFIDDEVPELIKIEDDVIIAFRVTITAHDDSGQKSIGPVCLKKGCYLGTGAIVLAGVTIGEGAVVGAGAVVARSVDAGATVCGVPAKKL